MGSQMGTQPDAKMVSFLESVMKPLLEKNEAEPSLDCAVLIYTQSRGLQTLLKAARSPNISSQDRFRLSTYGIAFFNRLNKQVVVDFIPKKVHGNFGRPVNNSPEAQSKFEDDVRVNKYNIAVIKQQRELANVLPSISNSIIALLKDTVKRYPELSDQAAALRQRLAEKEKDQRLK